ncbi:MAG TPA: DUF488 domain-containing protein [Actinomycetes bacterium]|nr:DUF488 domain-containing protein [Actinomycetes bacterium]
MPTLYTVGYGGRSPEALRDLLPPDALVLDIRLKAWSRDQRWTSFNLSTTLPKFGLRYRHDPRLGNLDYRGDSVRIADTSAAVPLAHSVMSGETIVLMCVCRQPQDCHRLVVADMVRDIDSRISISHLGSDPSLGL